VRAVVEAGRAGGVRVRLDGCPRCRRPLVLEHCGTVVDGEPMADLAAVEFAQALHLATCRGR
jgi:hypothetical protein